MRRGLGSPQRSGLLSAAVRIVFHGLAGSGGEPVSPVFPTILRALGERDLAGTWVVDEALADAEPFALTMLRNARNEVTYGPPPPAATRDAEYLSGEDPQGVNALHAALQIAIVDAVRTGEEATLTFTPGLLERADALAVFVETLELVAGLRDAGRLSVR